MQKNCNIVIRRSKTPRLLTSNMHVHVHICNIYSYIQRIYICVYNAVFGGYHSVKSTFTHSWGIVGKSPTGILTVFI